MKPASVQEFPTGSKISTEEVGPPTACPPITATRPSANRIDLCPDLATFIGGAIFHEKSMGSIKPAVASGTIVSELVDPPAIRTRPSNSVVADTPARPAKSGIFNVCQDPPSTIW